MSKKITSSVMLILMLFNLWTVVLYVKPALASETIFIKVDGSIYPPTANITSADNVTYYFTDNNYHEIVVQKSNIILDGNGYKLCGSEVGYGFYSYNINNVTILNTSIENFKVGICLNSSSFNTISLNHIINNDKGIWLRYSSDSNTISENNIVNFEHGIQLFYNSMNNEVSGNNISLHLDDGIQLFEDCSNNIISGNWITENNDGIELWRSSDNNIISRNFIAGNKDEGVWIYKSSYNTIIENTITNNKQGVELEYSSFNSINHNTFVENTQQAINRYSGYANTWDDGFPSGGNYWSDYTERYPDAKEIGSSGIWDTPYDIDEDNRDNYPLMGPWHSWEYIFEDPCRGTELQISTDDQYFQFIAPNKTFSAKYDSDMFVCKSMIIICFEDEEIRLRAVANTKIDFCIAFAKDMQTSEQYFLLDKPDWRGWRCSRSSAYSYSAPR
jgi:parallel beta-helix repeat protein